MITTHPHRMPTLQSRQPERKPTDPAAAQQPQFSGKLIVQPQGPSFDSDDITDITNSVYTETEEAPLQKLQEDLDHTAPRGKSRIPAFLEVGGETAGGIAMDLSRLVTGLPLLPVKGAIALGRMGHKRLAERFDYLTPEQRQAEEIRAKNREAIDLMKALTEKVNLDEIQDEDNNVIPPMAVKARVLAALKQKSEFMEAARDSLSNPVMAAVKWPMKAKPNPQDVVQALANIDFQEVEEDESAKASLLMQPSSSEDPDPFEASSSRQPFSTSRRGESEMLPWHGFASGASGSGGGDEEEGGISGSSPRTSPGAQRLQRLVDGQRPTHKFKISDPQHLQRFRQAAFVALAAQRFKEGGARMERGITEPVVERFREEGQARAERRDENVRRFIGGTPTGRAVMERNQEKKREIQQEVVETWKEAAEAGKARRENANENARRFIHNTATWNAAQLKVDIGQSETDAIVRDMRISGSLLTKGARALADTLRKNPSYLPKERIDQEEFQSYLEKGKLPPTKNPYELMVLNPHDFDEEISIQRTGGLTERLGSLFKVGQTEAKGIQAMLPKMRVSSTDPNVKLLLSILLKGQEANLEAKGIKIGPRTQVAVKIRDTESFHKNVLEPLVNTYRLTEEIPLKDGKHANLKESCLWPFLDAVIMYSDKKLGPNCTIKGTSENCFDRLADADIYQFESNNKGLEQFLNDRMHSADPKMKALKARLAAIQAASLHYAEQVEIRETVESFLKGAIVGVTGESLVDNLLGHGGGHAKAPSPAPAPAHGGESHSPNMFTQPNFWANVALLGLVDAYDNWQGEQGALEADLKGMGLKNIPEHVFGEEVMPPEGQRTFSAYPQGRTPKLSFMDNVRRYAKLLWEGDAGGPAAQSVANAYRSALLGATGGALVSLGAAQPFSRENSSVPELMGASAGAAAGTALSIPINFALTLPRVMATYNEHLRAGRLNLPDDVNPTDQKAVFNHIHETALQEMMARVGLQASAKAYTLVPGLGLTWLANIKNFIPRKVIQPAIFGVTPAAENLTRMGLTMNRLYKTFPETINQTERMVLASQLAEKEDASEYHQDFRKEFNDNWSKYTAKVMDWITYPILQRPLTYRRNIDYVKQPVGDDMV